MSGPWSDAIEQAEQLRKANFSAFAGWALACVLISTAAAHLGGFDQLQAIAIALISGWCAAGRLGRVRRRPEPQARGR